MKPFALALALSATLTSGAALAGDSLVQFNGAIGVDPVGSVYAYWNEHGHLPPPEPPGPPAGLWRAAPPSPGVR